MVQGQILAQNSSAGLSRTVILQSETAKPLQVQDNPKGSRVFRILHKGFMTRTQEMQMIEVASAIGCYENVNPEIS